MFPLNYLTVVQQKNVYSNSMKIQVSLFVLIISMLITGCGSDGENSVSKIDSTESPTSSTNEDIRQNKKWGEILKAEIIEFSVSKANCSYDDGTLELLVKLTNISSKEILAIDASAEIQDLFGEKIMGLNLDSDKLLPPGQIANVGSWGSSCWGLNNYNSDETRLMEMINVSELTKIVIEVSKIAFRDGEILEF